MKNLKIVIYIILIVLLIFLLNFIRNYLIINKIFNNINNFYSNNNYNIKETQIVDDINNPQKTTKNLYVYNDKALLIIEEKYFSTNTKIITSALYNYSTKELNYEIYNYSTNESIEPDSIKEFKSTILEEINNISNNIKISQNYYLNNTNKYSMVKSNLFNIIQKNNNCYKIKLSPKHLDTFLYTNYNIFIDYNTSLLNKIVFLKTDTSRETIEYTYSKDTLKPNDIENLFENSI